MLVPEQRFNTLGSHSIFTLTATLNALPDKDRRSQEGEKMAEVLYVICGLLGIAFRYQLGLTQASKVIGVQISSSEEGAGFQDAITPPSSTRLTVLIWALVIALLAYAAFTFGWGAFGIALGVFLIVSVIAGATFIPKSDSAHFTKKIYRSMVNRYVEYEKQGDMRRAEAIKILIDRVEHQFGKMLS